MENTGIDLHTIVIIITALAVGATTIGILRSELRAKGERIDKLRSELRGEIRANGERIDKLGR